MPPGAEQYLQLSDAALLAQCEVHIYRASGPGGQKRNKTSSAVRLVHRPSGLIVIGTESRSQHENKARALRRIRAAIALHVRRRVDPESYAPSDLLRSCISRDGRLLCGRRDERYWPVVAEVLDLLDAHGAAVRDTAAALGISTAHLVGFLRKDPKLWQRTNEMRAEFKRAALR
jgi:hypothetical protein